MVPMDAMLIEQVINNLLENAHFHSGSEKPIELKVRTENGVLYITIKDHGKGIDPKRLPTLFDGGGVNTNESGDSHKGMGIGLSICKTIINDPWRYDPRLQIMQMAPCLLLPYPTGMEY